MKQIVHVFFWAASAASTFAAPTLSTWVRLDTASHDTFYIDYGSIRKAGELRTVWEIQDLSQRSKNGVMSR